MSSKSRMIKIFLCGDVMTGRGIDQILKVQSIPSIHEGFMTSAEDYVSLAEQKLQRKIPRNVDDEYIWGDALREITEERPDLRIINLETAVTISESWEHKGINYRMNPKDIGVLTSANIDCCILANNHVLDWGTNGLIETMDTLSSSNIAYAGAGKDIIQAQSPAVFELEGKGRVLVFGIAFESSGVSSSWEATRNSPGVFLMKNLSENSAKAIGNLVKKYKTEQDIVILSIHWGSNWGYELPGSYRNFARNLVENFEVDIIHGHSSHHPRGIEIHNGKLIMYGCGDLINDYEGISGYDEFRSELRLLYFVELTQETHNLKSLKMVPMEMKGFRLHLAATSDADWMHDVMSAICSPLHTQIKQGSSGELYLTL